MPAASSRRRKPTAPPGLPSDIREAINRRAFALARQTYPAIQNDLQALAWDLMGQGLSAPRIADAIAQAEVRGGRPDVARFTDLVD